MGIIYRNLIQARVLCIHGTPGGPTYWVDGIPKCLGMLVDESKEDQLCEQKGGYGTDHPGTGRCKYHGGNAGAVMKHGRYSHVTKRRLKVLFDKYNSDPDLMNLMPELALLRTLLDESLGSWQETMKTDQLKLVLRLMDSIGTTVERIDRIQSRQVLTAASVRLIMAKALEIAQGYIPPDTIESFVMEWRTEVGGLLGETVPETLGTMVIDATD